MSRVAGFFFTREEEGEAPAAGGVLRPAACLI